MSKRSKMTYKFLMIDYDERDFRVRRRNQSGYGRFGAPEATEMRVFGSNQGQVVQPADEDYPQPLEYGNTPTGFANYGSSYALVPAPEIEAARAGPVRYRRSKRDFGFHFICACVGILFTMAFSNWTSIYGYTFTASDIVDTLTVWVRFSGVVAGLAIILLISIINLIKFNSSI